jgi:putative transposase
VGIDLGLNAVLTTSDGTPVANPRMLRSAATMVKRLKRPHRRVSWKKKGSQNRRKAVRRLAKGHLAVSRRRKDVAAKTAKALIPSQDLVA